MQFDTWTCLFPVSRIAAKNAKTSAEISSFGCDNKVTICRQQISTAMVCHFHTLLTVFSNDCN